MKHLLLGLSAAGLLCGGSAAQASDAEVAPPAHLIIALDRTGDAPPLTPVQFIYGGRNFCWYAGGWQGPGFYWCGYAWRSGYGWGGGDGFHGWRGGGGGGGNYRGGGGNYRGGGGHNGGGGQVAHGGGGHTRGAATARAGGHGGGHPAGKAGAEHPKT